MAFGISVDGVEMGAGEMAANVRAGDGFSGKLVKVGAGASVETVEAVQPALLREEALKKTTNMNCKTHFLNIGLSPLIDLSISFLDSSGLNGIIV